MAHVTARVKWRASTGARQLARQHWRMYLRALTDASTLAREYWRIYSGASTLARALARQLARVLPRPLARYMRASTCACNGARLLAHVTARVNWRVYSGASTLARLLWRVYSGACTGASTGACTTASTGALHARFYLRM